MKIKRIISILLVLTALVTMLTSCGKKEEKTEKSTINPELISAFGEEIIKREEDTIAKLVGEFEDCYKEYERSKDLTAFAIRVRNTRDTYEDYLNEIRNEVKRLCEEANGSNEEETAQLYALLLDTSAFNDMFIWESYLFNLELNKEPQNTDNEVEEALIQFINGISEFFYCKPIVK